MLIVMKKEFTISVTIREGEDEFWHNLRGKSGADEVVEEVKRALADHGFVGPECHVRLTQFRETA